MILKIKRIVNVQSVTVGTDTASSSSARCDHMAGAAVIVRGNTASATFTVWGSADDVTFGTLMGADGATATLAIPAAGGAVDVPGAAFAAPYLRFVTSAALSTAASVAVAFKS